MHWGWRRIGGVRGRWDLLVTGVGLSELAQVTATVQPGQVMLAPSAVTQLASAAPAAGLVDLLDTTHARFAPSPIYPEEARWEGREGRVLLRFRLRADGRVAEAVVLGSSGHADLDAAALATIRHWSFGTPGGTATAVWYRHTFRFALR